MEVASGCAGSGRNFLPGHRTVSSVFLADASAVAAWGHCSSFPACIKGTRKGDEKPARPRGQPALMEGVRRQRAGGLCAGRRRQGEGKAWL